MKQTVFSARPYIERRKRRTAGASDEAIRSIPRGAVYNDLPTIPAWSDVRPTTKTRRQADRLFDQKIVNAPSFKHSKVEEKRGLFQRLFHSLIRATYHEGCVMYPRNLNRPECSRAKLQL